MLLLPPLLVMTISRKGPGGHRAASFRGKVPIRQRKNLAWTSSEPVFMNFRTNTLFILFIGAICTLGCTSSDQGGEASSSGQLKGTPFRQDSPGDS